MARESLPVTSRLNLVTTLLNFWAIGMKLFCYDPHAQVKDKNYGRKISVHTKNYN